MKKLLALLVSAIAALALASCGGTNTITSPGGGGGGGVEVASVQLIASSTQLPSDKTGTAKVFLTVIVRDANNNVVPDLPVAMGATSGALLITQATTDANGTAKAELTNGLNPQNRVITVSATAGASNGSAGVTQSLDIDVVGTTLVVTGPTSLALGNNGQYTAVLKDSEGVGIGSATVTFTSSNGNVVSPPSRTTNASGDAAVTLTAGTAGATNSDTLTASALGLSAPIDVSISGDSFAFTSPAAGTEVVLGASQVVQVQWLQSGAPVANGSVVNFSSTRGGVSAVTTTTAGVAQATITSNTAGSAVVTATDPISNTTATLNLEFIATQPATLDLQASPFTVPVNGQSALTAVVRDTNQQLVKNTLVQFEIVNDTSGSPGVSPGTDLTDSLGAAQSFYTAGPNSTAQNGVTIRAYIGPSNAPIAEDTVQLTVSQQALFISLGTGNDLFEPTTASFAKEWDIIVTDSVGNAVANKAVQVSLNSLEYRKGTMLLGPLSWTRGTEGIDYVRCNDEDANRNGILDVALGEDFNHSGRIEAGNVATVAAVPASAPANDPCTTANAGSTSVQVTTNNQGLARVCVIYPQDHNWWVRAQIEAKASVSGTEFARLQTFLLDAKSEDINKITADPPGVTSPFGTDLDCTNTN